MGIVAADGRFLRFVRCLEPVVAAAEWETGRRFEVLEVKEKFGGLRFYLNYQNDLISTLIEVSQFESLHTCGVCGQPGQRRGDSWIQTLSDEHTP
jgi:hypothetical protein